MQEYWVFQSLILRTEKNCRTVQLLHDFTTCHFYYQTLKEMGGFANQPVFNIN